MDKPRTRVLVIDDHHDTSSTLAMLLQALDYEAKPVTDAHQAIAELRRFVPQVVLLDLVMPGMTGFELARLIRKEPGFGDVLLIAVTGLIRDQDKTMALDAGFNQFLMKPFKLAELSLMIQELLHQRSTPTVR